MLLAIDIGNSAIKFGTFDGDTLTSKFFIPTKRNAGADELTLAIDRRLPSDIDSALVCSVVPSINGAVRETVRSATGVEPTFIKNSSEFGLKIDYSPLESLGTDRLVNAFAAIERYGAPAIVCSLGTATTIDVVSAEREFLGGIIGPGLEAMAEAVHAKAPRLPKIDTSLQYDLIGNTTEDAVGSGIYNGYVAMVEGLITRIRTESGVSKVVATGGNAERLKDELAGLAIVDVDLLVHGLRMLSSR